MKFGKSGEILESPKRFQRAVRAAKAMQRYGAESLPIGRDFERKLKWREAEREKGIDKALDWFTQPLVMKYSFSEFFL